MANAITSTTTAPAGSSSTANNSASSTSAAARSPSKRSKIAPNQPQRPALLPGLPDHIAQLCLSKVHPSFLYSVCRSWRHLLYSPSFPPFLSLYALLTPPSSPGSSPPPQFDQGCLSKIEVSAFDPVASKWRTLPPPLPDQQLSLLLRHPSFLSRNFPIQSVSVSGNFVLLAGTAHNFFPAISRPLIFNPISGRWTAGPPLSAPRRWCAAGASGGAVYVASGMGTQFSTDVARSVEKWDLNCIRSSSSCGGVSNRHDYLQWNWQKLRGLKDGRFSRDAIDAVGWRGKLCMVNMKGGTSREGVMYDINSDTWQEMSKGMIGGLKGPAASMDEEVMYAIDVAIGALRRYDPERDAWDDIMVSENLKGAQQIAAAGGRVCVVCEGGTLIAVVDVEAAPPQMWVLDTPDGTQAVAVHILPRMSYPDLPEDLPFP